MTDPADLRAEGHREGMADALDYVAALLVAVDGLTKGKAGFVAGLAHLARRGVSLPTPAEVAAMGQKPARVARKAKETTNGTTAP